MIVWLTNALLGRHGRIRAHEGPSGLPDLERFGEAVVTNLTYSVIIIEIDGRSVP